MKQVRPWPELAVTLPPWAWAMARDGQAQARAIDVGMNLRGVSAVGAVKQLLTSLKYDVCAAVLYRNRGSFYRMGNASGGITALGRVALDSRLPRTRRNSTGSVRAICIGSARARR